MSYRRQLDSWQTLYERARSNILALAGITPEQIQFFSTSPQVDTRLVETEVDRMAKEAATTEFQAQTWRI